MSESDVPKEPSIVMTRRDKRDLMIVGVPVIVAVVVVVGALMIPPPNPTPKIPTLTASLQPGTAYLAAGRGLLPYGMQ